MAKNVSEWNKGEAELLQKAVSIKLHVVKLFRTLGMVVLVTCEVWP